MRSVDDLAGGKLRSVGLCECVMDLKSTVYVWNEETGWTKLVA